MTAASLGKLGTAMVEVTASTTKLNAGFAKAKAQAGVAGKQVGQQFSKQFSGQMVTAERALKGLLGSLAVNEVRKFADAWTDASNKIKVASQVSGVQADQLRNIADAAIRTRTELSAYIDIYSRLLRNAGKLEATQYGVARAAETVAKAFKAGGASATEASAGILQLGQALSAGLLQGDELRSIRENAPLIAQAIADEMGTTVGELKKLGAEGKITGDILYKALISASDGIDAAFAQSIPTIADSFNNLRTAVVRFVGDVDDVVGGSEAVAKALTALSKNLDLVAIAASALAVRGLLPLAATALTPLIAQVRLASVGFGMMSASMGTAARSTALLTAAGGALAAVMRIILGPLGLITIGIWAAVEAFGMYSEATRSATELSNDISDAFEDGRDTAVSWSAALKDNATATNKLTEAKKKLSEALKKGDQVGKSAAEAEIAQNIARIKGNDALISSYKEVLEAKIALAQADLRQLEGDKENAGRDARKLLVQRDEQKRLESGGSMGAFMGAASGQDRVGSSASGLSTEEARSALTPILNQNREALDIAVRIDEITQSATTAAEAIKWLEEARDSLVSGKPVEIAVGGAKSTPGGGEGEDDKDATKRLDSIKDLNAAIAEEIQAIKDEAEALKLEGQMIDETNLNRNTAMDLLQIEQDQRKFLLESMKAMEGASQDEIAALEEQIALGEKMFSILKNVTAARNKEGDTLEKIIEKKRRLREAEEELRDVLKQSSDELIRAVIAGDSLRNVLANLLIAILQMTATQNALEHFLKTLLQIQSVQSSGGGGGGGGGFSWGSFGMALFNGAVKGLTGGMSGGVTPGISGPGPSIVPSNLAGLPGMGGSHPQFASGGFAEAGTLALVGEHGPEPVYFGGDARVLSNRDMKEALSGGSGGRGASVTFNIQTPDVGSFRRSQPQISADLQRMLNLGNRQG